jgi:hypothetical protein
MTEPQANRRRSFRAEVEGCAIVHAPGGVSMRCRVADLGLGGVKLYQPMSEVADDAALPSGLEVTLELECAGAGWVVQRGRVVRGNDSGAIAIVFDELAPEVLQLISDEMKGAVEAAQAPRVVIVDRAAGRRRHIADVLRQHGCCSLEAATPLEAVAMVERSRNHVRAVMIAETLTQTQADELREFLAEAHPTIAVVSIDVDDSPLRELVERLRS